MTFSLSVVSTDHAINKDCEARVPTIRGAADHPTHREASDTASSSCRASVNVSAALLHPSWTHPR